MELLPEAKTEQIPCGCGRQDGPDLDDLHTARRDAKKLSELGSEAVLNPLSAHRVRAHYHPKRRLDRRAPRLLCRCRCCCRYLGRLELRFAWRRRRPDSIPTAIPSSWRRHPGLWPVLQLLSLPWRRRLLLP